MAFETCNRYIFEAHPLPNGTQVLVPKVVRPRCCSRADGVAKVRYQNRTDANAAKLKHQKVYQCSCGFYHIATHIRAQKPFAARKNRRFTTPAGLAA